MTVSSTESPHDFIYTLRTKADGFASALHILNPPGGQLEMIHDVILDPSLRIAGRVTDRQNQPLDGVRVYANRPGYPGNWELTNSEGIYGFEDVLPGRYDLLFQYTEVLC
jgi:protocatechuate 3,4-dioxygenase beta subunit